MSALTTLLEHAARHVSLYRGLPPTLEMLPVAAMLAAFIFGVADHVETAYWMKVDADRAPRLPWWEWPEYEDQTIVSHRWGFTKMKGEKGARRHWFNRLDDVFSPNRPYFSMTFDPVKHSRLSHRPGNIHGLAERFNSTCHIEKTHFTRSIAEHLRQHHGGRMAIPSQDTTCWYCAQLWGERVALTNVRRWF